MLLRKLGVVYMALAVGAAVSAVPAVGAPLPDGRHFEMVSPPSKNGADVVTIGTRTRASADGDAVAFLSLTGFGDVRGGGISSEYIGVRDVSTTNGWATHAITPGPLEPASFLDNIQFMESRFVGEFSADFQHAAFTTTTPLTATSPNTDAVPKLYLLDDLLAPGAKSPVLLSDCLACSVPLSPDPVSQPALAWASSDFRHVIFESAQSLTSDVPFCEPLSFTTPNDCPLQLYEWADGTLRLAGVLPNGDPAPNSQAGQGATPPFQHYTPNTISRDGSRIFFTVRGSGLRNDGALYMRSGNSTASPSTVQLNASERTPPDAAQDGRYWAAASDGSRVFFTSGEQLTNDTGSGLYMYDASKPDGDPANLSLLFNGPVYGVIGASDDGSYVYFVSTQPSPAIQVWHDGVVHQITPISGADEDDLASLFAIPGRPKLARLTPDGQRMTFVLRNGGDAVPHSGADDTCGSNGASPCSEVYVYDATANSGAGELTCASCQQPPSTLAHTDASIRFLRGWAATGFGSHLNHAVSDDGRFVFFSTGEALVPGDTNGTTQDVYEYDTVTREVHLLSSGAPGGTGSYFMDASASGHDVFFTTRDQLVGWDIDEHVDLYDARVGGGFPEPVKQRACDASDSCRSAPSPVVTVITPPSGQVSGGGNARPHRAGKCSKGRVRRRVHGKVRCVKKHRHVVSRRHRAGARVQRSGGR